MISTLRILSVGSAASSTSIRDVLLLRTKCRLFVAESSRDLVAIPPSETVDVAILHQTLPRIELRTCAETVRHGWPDTRILLVHTQVDALEDPMYDERITPHASAGELLAKIELLAAMARRTRQRLQMGAAASRPR